MLGARKFFIFIGLRYIFGVEFWTQRVNVEEWVFSMVYLRCWLSIHALESLVANSWEIHVSSLLSDFNTLEPIRTKYKKFIVKFTYSASWKL